MQNPTLYSFRRCPYAIRARLAIVQAGIEFELREIQLKDKPKEMLRHSPKGTVPVAITSKGIVIEESLELMLWSLAQHDPNCWLDDLDASLKLVQVNDRDFKYWLDRYKYQIGYPEQTAEYYRDHACEFLHQLEERLTKTTFLLGPDIRLADVALFPFVRQFAFVDKSWFDQAAFPRLQVWLNGWLESPAFQSVMRKYDPWVPGSSGVRFPDTDLI